MQLSDLQTAVKSRLDGDSYFAGPPAIATLCQDDGDLVEVINEAIAKIGVAVVIGVALKPGGVLRNGAQAELRVVITERGIVNRDATYGTQKKAIDIGLNVVRLMLDWSPNDLWSPFVMTSDLDIVVNDSGSGVVVYEVHFGPQTVLVNE